MLNWSFKLYRLFGITVRIHWLWPVVLVSELFRGWRGGYTDYAAGVLAIL